MNPPHKIHYVREKHSSLCTKLLLKLTMKHGHSWEGAALEFDVAWRGVRCPTWLLAHRCRVWVIYLFIIIIYLFFLHGFSPHIGQIGSYRPVAKIDRNRLKSAVNHAGTAKNRLWMRPKHPKSVILQFYCEYLLLLLCFVLCFLPSSFFVLWTKDI